MPSELLQRSPVRSPDGQAHGAGVSLGQPMRGPSAVGGDLRRFLTLTVTLAVTDFKLKFFGSVLGYLWQLMRPLMLFGVLYVVFTQFVKLGAGVEFYGVILLTNIVMFMFFSEATANAIGSLVDREGLVRKVQFPRLAVPLSVVLTALFNFSLNLVAVFVFVTASGVPVRGTWVQLPLLIGALAFFATGFAMLLSTLYVRARDVRPIWEVVLQVLFYASPILYVIELVPNESLRQAMLFNPLALILQQTRYALMGPEQAPAAATVAGWGPFLVAGLFVIGVFALGLWLFTRQAPRIAEEL